MKKLIPIIAFLFYASFSFAQANVYPGYPAFGISSSTDRTYRQLQLGTTTIADTLGATSDTLQLIPGFVSGAGAVFNKYYVLNLKDSCVLSIAKLQSSYTFSEMTLQINAPSITSKVYFTGFSGLATQWSMVGGATSVSPTASHTLFIHLICTGTKWAETSRSQD